MEIGIKHWEETSLEFAKENARLREVQSQFVDLHRDWLTLRQENEDMRQAMKTAYNNTASHPKVSIKPFLLHTFEKFWEPELVAKLKGMEGTK